MFYRGLSIGPRYDLSSHPHTSTFSHIQNHVLTLLSYSDRRANVPKQSWWTTHHRHRGLRAIVYAAYKMGWHWFNGWWVLTHLDVCSTYSVRYCRSTREFRARATGQQKLAFTTQLNPLEPWNYSCNRHRQLNKAEVSAFFTDPCSRLTFYLQ